MARKLKRDSGKLTENTEQQKGYLGTKETAQQQRQKEEDMQREEKEISPNSQRGDKKMETERMKDPRDDGDSSRKGPGAPNYHDFSSHVSGGMCLDKEEGPWMKQECRKRRHSPPQVTKKTRKKHLSSHNPNSNPEESEEEEQPGNECPDDQLDQVTRVLQEMRALASVMEASRPLSPATAEKEETSMEEEEQSLPANLEEEESETRHVGKPASEKHQATVAQTTAPVPETCQEPDQSCK
ncbi:hypothetical protein NDU88_002726 [Pleurodeles waltl]|uniref:Uncharacterized protein n=1 Tax=Pleurodeles waltl TaxID=8319 RepID=A0AAV7T385_PLEWA|nr:hypothetical protein NDU88_002726 [Pleurodeles waltl]